jgi:hypothetical protein
MYTTLKFLALQGAPYIYDISRLRVKPPVKFSAGGVARRDLIPVLKG